MRKNELREMTRVELLEAARQLEIKGRSGMSKDELVDAIAAASRSSARAAEKGKRSEAAAAVARREEPPARRGDRRPSGSPDGNEETSKAAEPPAESRATRVPPPPPASGREAPPPEERPAPRSSRPDPEEEDEDDHRWNSVALGHDPNYGRFLAPGSIPARPGAPSMRRPAPGGPPRPHGDSLSDRSERGRMRAGERSYGAREDLRRSGDARRQSGYTPQYSRPGGRDDRDEPRRGLPPRDADRRRGEERSSRDRDRDRDRDRSDRGRSDRDRPRGGDRPAHPAGRDAASRRPAARRPEAGEEPGVLVPEPETDAAVAGAASRPAPPLPRHYGLDRCRLMVRDPYCIHAYWEVNQAALDRAREELAAEWEGHKRILRVHGIPVSGDADEPPADFFDVDLKDDADNWYVPVPRANRGYRVDIGLLTGAGLFYPMASSNTAITPRDTAGRTAGETWVAPPRGGESADGNATGTNATLSTTGRAAGPVSGGGAGSDDAAAAGASVASPQNAAGETASGSKRAGRTRSSATAPPDSGSTAGPAGMSASAVPGSPGAAFSDSGRGLLPPGPGIPPAAVGGAAPAGPTSLVQAPGGAAGGAPTGAGAAGQGEQGFWFVLNTELLVYGATDPSAKVTLQGQPVPLRPDGTFSVRFQLPDGTQVLEARAVSADGHAIRVITPTITRQTVTDSEGRE